MLAPITHYRDVIERTYLEHRQVNRKYSMASFARKLGLSPAQLSKVLAKKQNLSFESAQKVGKKLFPKELRYQDLFLDLFRASVSDSPEILAVANAAIRFFNGKNRISLDQQESKFVCNWYVMAVFDLLSLREPPRSAKEISQSLGIEEAEAAAAIRSLESIGLIEPKNDFYAKKVSSFTTTNNVPSREIQNLHRQFIGKALQAIEKQSVEQRYFKTMTVCLNSSLIPEFRGAVDRFLGEIAKIETMSAENSDRLYQLNVQLFDLIQHEKENEDEIA